MLTQVTQDTSPNLSHITVMSISLLRSTLIIYWYCSYCGSQDGNTSEEA